MARANWRFYARGSAELFPTSRFQPLDLPLPPGYRACNPSLAIRHGQVWCALRSVNYVLDQGCYRVDGDGIIRTQNYLLRLDESLGPAQAVPIVDEPADLVENAAILGLEDVRLFCHEGRLRASCTVADRDPSWRRQMAVFDLSDDGQVHDLTLQGHENHHHQKNWVPFVDDQGVGFVYWTDPTVLLRWEEGSRQSHPWRQHPCRLALEHQRGSSGAIPFDDGWLYLSHEVSWLSGQRTYLHRFVHLAPDFRVQAVTEPFYFRTLGIEFCGGLVAGPARGLEAGHLLASFGVNDGEAWLVVLEASEVRRQLRGVGSTRGARRRSGRAAP